MPISSLSHIIAFSLTASFVTMLATPALAAANCDTNQVVASTVVASTLDSPQAYRVKEVPESESKLIPIPAKGHSIRVLALRYFRGPCVSEIFAMRFFVIGLRNGDTARLAQRPDGNIGVEKRPPDAAAFLGGSSDSAETKPDIILFNKATFKPSAVRTIITGSGMLELWLFNGQSAQHGSLLAVRKPKSKRSRILAFSKVRFDDGLWIFGTLHLPCEDVYLVSRDTADANEVRVATANWCYPTK